MNVSAFLQKDYENKSNWTIGENKPNSNPIKPKKTNPNKPNFKRDDGFSAYYTRDCNGPQLSCLPLL
jgi:hypothetical protein